MRAKTLVSLRCAAIVLAVFVGACAGAAQRPSALDEDFELSAGRSVRVADADLLVRFDRVANDSRCPSDVKCITAGDAVVVLGLASGRDTARQYELHTTSGDTSAAHAGYRVTLVALNPVPVSTRTLQARDYVATLRVTRERG
jgi:hypothetical protein